ncbi:MAG: hypothetical protein ABI234_20420 [Ktedonobacteraceae bacterium]
MDNGQQVEQYLEALAQELDALGVLTQYHLVITGGAYLLLHQERKYTEDIDFALIAGARRPMPDQVFRTTVQREEVSSLRSRVPYAAEFKQGVANVAMDYRLPLDWMNDEAAEYYYEDAPEIDVAFWRAFGSILFVYLPTADYVFATKVMAYRPKDQDDIKLLIQRLDIRTRDEAQEIIDRYVTPQGQQFYEVRKKIKRLFR